MVFKSSVEKDLTTLRVTPTDGGATVNSPVRYGEKVGISLTGTSDIVGDSKCTMFIARGICQVSVKGVDGGGNSAVAAGDKLYYVDADTPKISKKTAGRYFGIALGAVTSGSTSTIDVLVNG